LKDKRDIRPICHVCLQDYKEAGIYIMYRVDPKKDAVKNKCMGNCQQRNGYEYVLIPKRKKHRPPLEYLS
jgi:hypothetical protein